MPEFFFLNRAFLLGLFAAAIPLFIHLFTRKKAKKLSFSSVEFLRDVARRESRRLRVRNLLLMILRTAVICAFVLAMARPVLRGPLVKGPGSTAAVVVLDNSASMGSLREEGTVFDNASEIAREIFGGLDDKDEGTLIPVCGIPESAALLGGGGRLVGTVGFLEQSHSSSRPDEAVKRALSLLKESKSINRELYIISDFQRNQWQKLRVSLESATGVSVVLVPVLPSRLDNLSIQNADVIPTGATSERILEFAVVNHGRRSHEGVPVKVLADGEEIASRYVDVPGAGSAAVSLELVGDFSEIKIVIPSDALPLDNVRYVALQEPKQMRVLVLGEKPLVGKTDFVSLALRPTGSATGENVWGFFPLRLDIDDLTTQHLQGVPCVVLDNVGRFSGSEIELLREHRSSGGRFLIALGDKVDIRHYNESLLPALFPARLVGIEGTEDRKGSFFSLSASIPSHPILRNFKASRGEAICEAKIYRLVRAEAMEGSRVVAEFSEGLPAVLEAEAGLLFTSSFEPGWNDLVTSGAFPALLHEMARYLCGGGALAGRDFEPGAVLEEEIPASLETPLSLLGPEGREVATSKRRLGTAVHLRSVPVDEPGLYRLTVGEEVVGTFSVNLAPSESELDPLKETELLGTFQGASVVGGDSIAEAVGGSRSGQELWPLFLVLCLGFMVAELFVARSAAPSGRDRA
ncbi:MAG: hypothetical protein AMJ46_02395 [Latescibacteria bacterium DG_63]|nr:MAG: hypothetical protein AMJ46_02395 [Latescibacteria bacterium DG_63]